MQTARESLHALAPMLQAQIANDSNGDIVIVYADAWAREALPAPVAEPVAAAA
jgi:hypothetical protein